MGMPLCVPQPSIHLLSKAFPGEMAPWLAGSVGAGPEHPLSAPSEIKLSVTAAVADCIVDAVLGDLTIAQCKLVSAGGCQHLQDGDVGLGCRMGSGYPSIVQVPGHQCCDHGFAIWEAGQNSHPGWFSSQIIFSQCGHSNINTLSKVPALLPCAGVTPGTGHSCSRAAALGWTPANQA